MKKWITENLKLVALVAGMSLACVGVVSGFTFSSVGGGTRITVNIDTSMLKPRGTWSALANYSTGHVVFSGGGSWVGLQPSSNQPPAQGAYWSKLADKGDTGATGATGAAGANGNTIRYGTTAPASGTGADGDFFLNTATMTLYGPKAAGVWPAGVSLQGPQGVQGVQGVQGPQGPQGVQGPQGPAGSITSATGIDIPQTSSPQYIDMLEGSGSGTNKVRITVPSSLATDTTWTFNETGLLLNGSPWGGAGGGTWGSITGTLDAQTDLQNALNAKQDTISAIDAFVVNQAVTEYTPTVATVAGHVLGIDAALAALKVQVQNLITVIETAGLDSTPPVLTRLDPESSTPNGSSVFLRYSSSDAESGLDATTPVYYSLNGGANVTMTGSAGVYSATAGTIPANQNSTIVVTAKNTQGATTTDTLTATNNQPVASKSPSQLAFGNVNVNETSDLVATVSNTGLATLSPTTATVTGTDAAKFSIVFDNCSGASVAPSGNCSVTARFTPGATAGGPYSATLNVPHNASGSPTTWALTGSGISSLACSSTPFVSQTATDNTSLNVEQYVSNSSNIQICKIRLYLDPDGVTSSMYVQLWTGADGTGTKLGGDSNTLTVSGASGWYDFTWQSDYPNPTGGFFVLPVLVSGSARAHYNSAGGYAGGDMYYNGSVVTGYDLTFEAFKME